MFHRNTLSRMFHVLCGLVFLSWNTEAAITNWTVPVISLPNGAATAAPKIPESFTPGHLTGINITATSDQSSPTITYVMLSQPVDGMFSINKSSGAIKFVKGVLDYEKTPSYVVRISATDATANGTANVTLELSNSPPVFSSKTYNKHMCDGAGTGTLVTTLKATDPGDSNVTYKFQGNTNGDFSLNANTGVMTVAAKKHLNMTAKSTYSLVVQATDTATQQTTGTSTVSVTVKTCSSGTSHVALAFPALLVAVLAKLF